MSLRSAFDLLLGSEHPLCELDNWLWQSLKAGSKSIRHDWNSGVFASIRADSAGKCTPHSRTVILRLVDRKARALDLFTDIRSQKVGHVRGEEQGSPVCWLFYTHSSKIQVRLEGRASCQGEEAVEEAWNRTPLLSRAVYASSQVPGQACEGSQPLSGIHGELTEQQSKTARQNFCVIRTIVSRADILYLRQEGHVRAELVYRTDGTMESTWTVP